MDLVQVAALLAAACTAGMINAVVGSGTLVTFPTLLALGYPPVTANISNNLGLVVGSAAAAWGYREELGAVRRLVLPLVPLSAAGAAMGALLLLNLPERAFEAIVPALIGLSLVLVVVQPRLAARQRERSGPSRAPGRLRVIMLGLGTLAAGVYGGYFGAAQGVLLIGLLGVLLPVDLQHTNAMKNLLAAVANGVAATVFVAVAPGRVDWAAVALVAAGAGLGGIVGAHAGRRLPAGVMRGVVVVVGTVALLALVLT